MTLLSPTLLAQLGELKPPVPSPDDNVWVQGLDSASESLGTMEKIISSVIGIMTVMAGLYFIITMILAGIDWISAGGDSGKVQKARDRMIQGALGLVVIVMAYAIVGLVGGVLGIPILNPAESLAPLLPAQ